MKTRELILEAARQCLNQHGVSGVNCRFVAKAAGLTPGNIYYYFENMDAIRFELGASIGRDVEASLVSLTGDRLASMQGRREASIAWLNIVWTWRYFFLDFDQIIRSDEAARTGVRETQKRSVDLQANALETLLVSNGLTLTEDDRQLCRDLAVSNWIVSINWIQHISLNRDISTMTRADFVATVDRYMTVSRTLYDTEFLTRLLNSK